MRPMVRTPEEFPRALAKKIEQNGGKRAVAARLGVTEGAINFWLNGTIPNRPNRERIRKELNLEILFMEKLTDTEAVAVNNMVNEQMVIDFEDIPEEHPQEETAPRWINLYRTPNAGIFKGSLEGLQFVLVKQKFKDKEDEVPFVLTMNLRRDR